MSDQYNIILSFQNSHLPIDTSHPQHILQSGEQTSKQIIDILNDKYNYSETEEEIKQKDQKLEQLRNIITDWVQTIANEKKIVTSFIGELLFFGSYKLKVNSRDSDIDTVCLVPHFVDRDVHFFQRLVKLLGERKEVKEIFPIKEASVPIIKMKFSGILFDLSFANAPPDYNGDIDLNSNSMLSSMDEKSCRSFNGYRVAEWLRKEENIKNYENFQVTLKCVKLWASKRGIYSNIIGYLSGIGWTILVAKICQLYPNYTPYQLLERFFFLYSRWKWSDLPVFVNTINKDEKNTQLNADQWRFEFSDRNSMMIITPCFPCMNCAHNVSATTSRIIQEQLQYGNRIFHQIKNQQQSKKNFSDLFKPFNFFKRYKHFLQINIVASNKKDYLIWKGHVESRLRKLTKSFETSITSKLFEVHPYPNPFEYTPESESENDQGGTDYESDQGSEYDSDNNSDNEDEEDANIESEQENFKQNFKSQKNKSDESKYKYQNIYFYGIRCISKETIGPATEIDLKEPILKFIECLEMPISNVPETMNIYFRHVTRNQIKFREKDVKMFSEKETAYPFSYDSLEKEVVPDWAKIKEKGQCQIKP